jgi:Niemann-Pick C1 protein
MRFSTLLSNALLATGILVTAVDADGSPTKIHEAGRCAMRGHCGKQGFFGKDLPCPDNGLAEEPSDDVRKKLMSICGDKWAEGPVCCAEEQV